MRVLFITGEYPSMQGGVGDYTRRVGQALGRSGVEVHVLTHVNAGADYLRTGNDAHEPTVYPILNSMGWGLWRQTRQLIARLRPAVVHVQYQTAAYRLHPAVNLLPWYLTRLTHGPRPAHFTTFHDLRAPYIFPKAGPLRWQAVLALARYSDAAVVTNPLDWARLAQARAALVPRLRPIAIGSNIRPQPPAGYDRAAQRAHWGAGPGDWLLAYFGFLNANKGGETLVRAAAHLARDGRPVRLLMVGGQVGASDPTNAAYLAHVENLIRELGIGDRVQWTGFTADAEVSANLLAADLAVLPYREGAQLRHGSLMAALAHGLPTVTTAPPRPAPGLQAALPLFPRLDHGSGVLLVPAEEPEQIAAAVCTIMDDDNLRRRLSEKALALSHQFDWDTIAQQHLQAYRALLTPRQAR